MQELRLVAVSEDGSYLVLATAGRGTRFTLPVDDRLRAAVRGHFSRLGQFEIEVESPLRPKEIQARIRAGETAEEIAESAGIPVERVRWFEGPVLQEREYMAQQAQRVVARRPGDASPGPPLGEMVEERLGRRGVDLEEVEWDSWKCEDSTWRVRLSFFDDGRPQAAEWTFDPRRRQIAPLDDEAARLSSLVLEEPIAPTVTPLMPRRPAMKIVSDSRSDVAAEQRREYGAERARVSEPRRQSVAPHRREYVAPLESEIVSATRARLAQQPPPAEPEPVLERDHDEDADSRRGAPDRGSRASEPFTEAAPETEPQAPVAEDERPPHRPMITEDERSPRPVVTEVVAEVVTEVTAAEPAAPPDTPARPETPVQPETPARPETGTESGQATADEAGSGSDDEVAAHGVEAETVVESGPGEQAAEPTPRPAVTESAAEVSATAEPEPPAEVAPESEPAPQPEPEAAPAEPVAAEPVPDVAEEAEQAKKVAPAPKRKVPVPAPTAPAPAETPARPGRRKNSARGKRASVPSWDEIMFGARRPD